MSINQVRHVASALLLVAAVTAPSRSDAQEANRYRDVARRVVQTSIAAKPGEVVMISGGPHTLPIMEAVGAEVTRAGAIPILSIESEVVLGAFYTDLPEQHLRVFDSVGTAVYGDQLKRADVFVTLPTFANPAAFSKRVESDTVRYAKIMRTWSATQERYDAMRNNARTRFVNLNYPPNPGSSARLQVDSTVLERMFMDAMAVDYDRIAATGRAIKRLLDTGKSVRVTTADGTDFRVSLTRRSAAVIGGSLTAEQRKSKVSAERTVSLPGGRVAVAPLETSATGKVVIARMNCQGVAMVNGRFEFRGGKVTGFQADSSGECLTRYLASSMGSGNLVGSLHIGLNSALKPIDTGVSFRPGDGSGIVTIGIGNNTEFGGKNVTPSGFGIPLARATVEIDGKVVVRDGQLVGDVSQPR